MKDFRGAVCTYYYNKKPGEKFNTNMLMDGKICEVVGLVDAITCEKYGFEYPTWDIRFEDNREFYASESNLSYEGRNAKTPKKSLVGSTCVYNSIVPNSKSTINNGQVCLVIERDDDDMIREYEIGEMFRVMFADKRTSIATKEELTKLTVIE